MRKLAGERALSVALVAAVGAAAILAVAPPALAWEAHRASDGQYVRWTTFPLRLVATAPPPGMHLAQPSDWRAAVSAAALTWQAVDPAAVSVRFREVPPSTPPMRGEVLLTFDAAANFPGGSDAAGLTELLLDHPGGHQIVSAVIHLNAREFNWATNGSADALDIQSVATHELGHALGLAHPCGDTGTNTPSCNGLSAQALAALRADVMFPSIQPGPRRVLAQDDKDGLHALTPATSAEPAPELISVTPGCIAASGDLGAALSNQLFTLDAPKPAFADTLQLVQDGAVIAEARIEPARAAGKFTAKLPGSLTLAGKSALLDVLLVDSASKKAGLLVHALEVSGTCAPPRGCSSAGSATWLLLLPVALFGVRRRKRAAGLAVLGGLLAVSTPAFAFKRSVNSGSLYVFWGTRGHSFYIDSRGTPDVVGPTAFDAIRHSFAAWATPACSNLFFEDRGLSTDRRVGFFPGEYNRNIVLFRTANCHSTQTNVVPPHDPCLTAGGCGNEYDCWDHDESVIATTTTTSNRFTGEISDTDIELNDSPAADGSKFLFTTVDSPVCSGGNQTDCVQIDLENTVTHEAGHSIGLDHSLDPTATMFATAPAGETAKRTLHADDTAGVCAIYPKGAATVTGLGDPIAITAGAGSDGGGCGCSSRSRGGGLEAAGLGAAVLLWRRQRKA